MDNQPMNNMKEINLGDIETIKVPTYFAAYTPEK